MTGPIQVEVGRMPWHLEYGNAECGDDQWSVVKDDDGSIEGCHDSRGDAVEQMQALYAADPEAITEEPAAALAAAANPHTGTGAMVAFLPTEEDAARLALDGFEPPEQLHMTSAYLGEADQFDDVMRKQVISDVAAAMAGVPAFEGEAFAANAFNPGGDDPCLVLGLGGRDLAMAQAAIMSAATRYAADEQKAPWIAHMTLAYDSDPYLLMGQDITDRMGPVRFDRVRVAFGDQVTDIPLGVDPQPVDEPVDEEVIVAAMAFGTPFEGILVVEGVPDGAGRTFAEGSVTWAPLPLPFKWQPAEAEGHEGSVIVGRIDEIWRDETDPKIIRVAGMFDDAGVNGAEALRLVRGAFLRGISLTADDVDESDIEHVYDEPVIIEEPIAEGGSDELVIPDDETEEFHMPGKHNQADHGKGNRGGRGGFKWTKKQLESFEDNTPELHSEESWRKRFGSAEGVVTADAAADEMYLDDGMPEPKTMFHAGRVRSVTLVPEPAWVEAEIRLIEMPEPEATRVEVLSASGQPYTIVIPELFPEDWFAEPTPEEMPQFGGLRITASGRITGFLAPPGVVHRAFRASGRPVTVPLKQDYSEFNNKPVLVAARDGGVATINSGSITFNCGHPDITDPRRAYGNAAVREVYDNSCSVFARVRIWESPRYPGAPIVAGALLHGVDADAIERAMGCHLSGDWQGGKLNAALLVPVEGFPPKVAGTVRIKEGQLVASAVPVVFEPRVRDQFATLARRMGLDPESQFNRLRERIGA